jgi:Transposase DDE domain
MYITLAVPDYSTLSRQMKTLEIDIPLPPTDKAHHVVTDSTGVKVYGEGERKTQQQGVSKRRTWMENLRQIRRRGRQDWKHNSHYHRRSLAKTEMFRLKTMFGDCLS